MTPMPTNQCKMCNSWPRDYRKMHQSRRFRHECTHPGGGIQSACAETVGRGGHEGAGRPYLLPAESVSAPWLGTQEQCRNQGGSGEAWFTAGYGHLRGV